jgi:glucan phosphoethanolaminetransferase (alkaline phosphatase superfamily)
MVCAKYHNKKILCIKKSILFSLIYAISTATIFIAMDILYATYNHYFLFQFHTRELWKVAGIILLISFIKQRKIRLSLLLTLLLFSFFQYIHFEYFGKNISAIEFYLFATNINETFETLNNMLKLLFIPLMLLATGIITTYKIDTYIGEKTFKFKFALSFLLLGLLYLSLQVFYLTNIKVGKLKQRQSKLIYPLTDRESARNFYVSMNYFLVGILPKKLFGNTPNFPILKKPPLIDKESNRTIILIIGESLRYDRFALYDNKLTPKLQKLKKEIPLYHKKIYSGGTMTKVSTSVLINRLRYPQGLTQINNEENCIFKLAKDNHKKTYFISAQQDKHLNMITNMICPKYIDQLITKNHFSDYIVPTGYDEDLLAMIKKLHLLNQGNLVVLQQRGSHSPYPMQYPKTFDKYEAYDNTALYTDTTLHDLISYVAKHATQETYLFYASDHGELLGENGKRGHGHLERNVYEVPFMMYTNHPDTNSTNLFHHIRNHFDISNYIISLLGYQVDLELNQDRELYIMNSDLEGFSGYASLKIINNKEHRIEIHRN